MYYILDGKNPIQAEPTEWVEWFEKADRLVKDETVNGTYVSTVFLGLNHQFSDGSPLLFETLVFGGELDGEIERYSTWDEAEEGHKKMVERVSVV